MHEDVSAIPVETVNALKALKRVKLFSFGNQARCVRGFGIEMR